MAQRVEIVLIDDLDGSDATETISFALDGATYEIDLSEENATALRSCLGDYLANARRAAGPGRRARSGSQRANASRSRA